jgi:hypothetical protein
VSSAPAGASLVTTAMVPVAAKVAGATLLASIAVGAGYVTLGQSGSGNPPRSRDAGSRAVTHGRPTLLADAAAARGSVRHAQASDTGGGRGVDAAGGRPGRSGRASVNPRGTGASNEAGRAGHGPNRFGSSGRSSNATPGHGSGSGRSRASGHARQARVTSPRHQPWVQRGGHLQSAWRVGGGGAAGSTATTARGTSVTRTEWQR